MEEDRRRVYEDVLVNAHRPIWDAIGALVSADSGELGREYQIFSKSHLIGEGSREQLSNDLELKLTRRHELGSEEMPKSRIVRCNDPTDLQAQLVNLLHSL